MFALAHVYIMVRAEVLRKFGCSVYRMAALKGNAATLTGSAAVLANQRPRKVILSSHLLQIGNEAISLSLIYYPSFCIMLDFVNSF